MVRCKICYDRGGSRDTNGRWRICKCKRSPDRGTLELQMRASARDDMPADQVEQMIGRRLHPNRHSKG